MSTACIPIDKLKKMKRDMSPEDTKAADALLTKTVEKFQNDSMLKDLHYNDTETLLWLFKKSVGVPLDLQEYNFSPADIKKFAIGVKEFKADIAHADGGVSNLLKIPRRLLSKSPETKKFVDAVELALSYYKDHTNEPAKNLSVILQSFTKLAKGFDVKPADLRKMELEFRKASHNFAKYDGKNEPKARAAMKDIDNIWKRITTHLTGRADGNLDNLRGRDRAGDLYLGLRDVLEGVQSVDTLQKSNGQPWSKQDKVLMKNIHDNYIKIREVGYEGARAGVGNLIRLTQLRARENDPYTNKIVKTIEKYQKIIKTLEEQSQTDRHPSENAQDSFVNGAIKTENGKPVIQRKYMPHYVLKVFEHLNDMQSMLSDTKSSNKDVWEKFHEKEKSFGGVIKRLQERQDITIKEYSLDPFYFMNKYIHDIARFNLSTSLDLHYSQAARSLEARFKKSKNATEVAPFAESLMETMNYTYDAILGSNMNSNSGLENMTRFITSVEHAAKMGGNIRSGIRNRLQKVFNYVQFGRQGLKFSKDFYTGANHREHTDLVTAALKKHGISWEAQGSNVKDIASMTRGAVENVDPNLPGEFKINQKGQMVDATPSMGEKLAQKAGDMASSGPLSGIHRRVENANRQETFKVAFALAYNSFKSGGYDFIKREMVRDGRISADKAESVTDKVADQYAADKAGNYAYHATIDLHFDYAKSGKPRVLRGKAGRVFGQYQHYRFSMIDLQSTWLKDAKRAMKAGDFSGQEMQRLYRMAFLYSSVGALGVLTNASLGNLVSNDTFGMMTQWYDFMTGDRETDEGKRQMADSFYGVGPVAGTIGGPVVSDILTMGEIADLWKLDEFGLPHREAAYNDAWKEKGDNSKLYNSLRIFNGQAARLMEYSLPAALKGDMFQALKIETGLYPSKKIRDTRNLIAEHTPDPIKEKFNEYIGYENAPAISSEDNLKELSKQLKLGTNKFSNKFQ